MSSIRTVLSVVGDAETGRSPIVTGLLVGKLLNCHIEGFHVQIDAVSTVPYVGEAMAGALIEEMVETAERDVSNRAIAARQLFMDICSERKMLMNCTPAENAGFCATWNEARGPEPEQVALRGRVADLIVLSARGAGGAAASLLTLNAALLESGRAVLLAPTEAPTSIGRHVAIAWNASAEAARAVGDAMPFLTRAEKVTVIIASDGDTGETGIARVDELQQNLAWHGVSFDTVILEQPGSRSKMAQVLIDSCVECGADLLVMGAYTHSRLRQLILGGVTRTVLETAPLPVLLSH
ncbi:universal stress protein [Phaeovibrio sulfidiphilus]|uniref:Universal stress protein n=1 Tax=Phaeovibrio sulfidiphilus TaxID=1220600 RepID=A0A8J6YNK4_9PROT|nr:universal stress protein [Phaeovibrio sulfidiphilus]MBE1237835.1 universal stress protein [Phaeovibrio sulfidiphilus]